MAGTGAPAAGGRRPLWRIAALILGLLVFFGHVATFTPPDNFLDALRPALKELIYHGLMLGSFALVYRLSFRRGSGVQANLATILVCGGWGALCEFAQRWVEYRTFVPQEVAANMLAPVAVVLLFILFTNRD